MRCADLLTLISEQAGDADRGRSVSPEVIAAVKASALMTMAASVEIGGSGTGVGEIAREFGPCHGSREFLYPRHGPVGPTMGVSPLLSTEQYLR